MKHRIAKYILEIVAVYLLLVVASWAHLEWANAKYESIRIERIYAAENTSVFEYVEYHGGVGFERSQADLGSDIDMISRQVEIKKAPLKLDWHDLTRCNKGEGKGYQHYISYESSVVYTDTREAKDSYWSMKTRDGETARFPNQNASCFGVSTMTVDKGMAEGLPPGTVTEIVIMETEVVTVGEGL